MISYEDLDLRVRADGDGFLVEARRGLQTASEPLLLDLSQSWDLWRPKERTPQEAERVGAALFDALIQGRVRDLYQQGRGGLGGNSGKGLRIRILLDPRDERLWRILRLPWESLFDRSMDAGKRLALNPMCPVVRTLDSIEQTLPPEPEPLREVLLVSAKPEGTGWIEPDSECTHVQEALARIPIRPRVLRRATYPDLLDSVSDYRPQIFHFMGHGDFDSELGEGVLLLEDIDTGIRALPASDLAQLFCGRPMPRLVILTACHSAGMGCDPSWGPFAGVAASLVALGLPAVIAMQAVVQDRSASRFTERLYRRLADGDPVEAAVVNARQALQGEWACSLDWAVPVLFVRGTPEVFLSQEPSVASTPTSEVPQTPPMAAITADLRAHIVEHQINNFGSGNYFYQVREIEKK